MEYWSIDSLVGADARERVPPPFGQAQGLSLIFCLRAGRPGGCPSRGNKAVQVEGQHPCLTVRSSRGNKAVQVEGQHPCLTVRSGLEASGP